MVSALRSALMMAMVLVLLCASGSSGSSVLSAAEMEGVKGACVSRCAKYNCYSCLDWCRQCETNGLCERTQPDIDCANFQGDQDEVKECRFLHPTGKLCKSAKMKDCGRCHQCLCMPFYPFDLCTTLGGVVASGSYDPGNCK